MWISTPGEYNAVYVSENLTLEVDRYMDGQSILCETSPAENWHKTFDDSVVLDINCKLSPFSASLLFLCLHMTELLVFQNGNVQ